MPPADDPDAGVCDGRSVARRLVSPDGFTVLIGRDAQANDLLTFRLAAPEADFWLHVASASGSHVVVRNPDRLAALPKETLRFAAGLAVRYSSARNAGRMPVHVARRSDVCKDKRAPDGEVTVRRGRTVYAGAS